LEDTIQSVINDSSRPEACRTKLNHNGLQPCPRP
jgi:hypothetical protein